MDKSRSWENSWNIAFSGIKKNFTSIRFYTVLLVAVIFAWTQIKGIREYAVSQGLGVSCWYYPFLFSTSICVLFLYFGLVLLFCNAPFVDGQQMFVILRSGKKTWFRGQIFYIILSSIGYFTYIFILSIVMYLPYVGITGKWGTVFREITRNPALTSGLGFGVNERALDIFSPIRGCLLIWLTNILIGCFLGFLIFYINLYKNRTYGSVAALMVVMVSNLEKAAGSNMNKLVYISPVSWTNLFVYARKQSPIPVFYTVGVLMLLNIVFALLIMRRSKKYSIEEMEDL
ncbi:MAG: hypothetical protein K2N51_14855 [Lachnospiraceae bacterium]|nr:hypothetical protein [Lachnospiraceae bacterium]